MNGDSTKSLKELKPDDEEKVKSEKEFVEGGAQIVLMQSCISCAKFAKCFFSLSKQNESYSRFRLSLASF